MEILQLKYFMHTARNENISHTAQKFRVPPSSVSSSIKKLESELGFHLFDRTANNLKLNVNGRIFLRAVEAAEKELKKAKTDILNLSAMPVGEIHLLILTNRRMVTEVIAKFKQDYPGVSFSIKHDDYYDRSNYNNFDIVISDRQIELDSFERRDFVREEVFLAVNHKSELAGLRKIDFQKLRREKFVCMPKGSSLRDFMDTLFKKMEVQPEIIIECDDPYYTCEYVKMGLGVTFFPSVSWKNRMDERVRLIRLNNGMYRHSYIYLNKKSTNIVKIFADALEFAVNNKARKEL